MLEEVWVILVQVGGKVILAVAIQSHRLSFVRNVGRHIAECIGRSV